MFSPISDPFDHLITLVGLLSALGGGTLVGLAYGSLVSLLGEPEPAAVRGALLVGALATVVLGSLVFDR